MAIGKAEYDKFKEGISLTRKQAMVAQCYICNGMGEGGEDCQGESCPLYEYMPHNPLRKRGTPNPKGIEALKKHREACQK